MSESQMLPREKVRQAIAGMLHVSSDTPEFRELKFPVSRRCTAEIRFSTTPGPDEWDALLAHIAFYRTWFPDDAPPLLSRGEIVDAVMTGIDKKMELTP